MRPTVCLALVLALGTGMTASGQYPRAGGFGGRTAGGRTATAVPTNGLPDAIATVNGTFKAGDKKFVTVIVEDDQLMRMVVTGSTKFIRDGKPAKVTDFELGEPVVVDTTRDQRMNLLAVRIELIKPGSQPKPEQKPDAEPRP